jgi:protein TonB
MMYFHQQTGRAGIQFASIAFVIALHLIVIYVLVSGLARQAAHFVAPDLITNFIELVQPSPQPMVKPPPLRAPKVAAAPPSFVPRPEVKLSAPPTA